jgi:hypothetical protein
MKISELRLTLSIFVIVQKHQSKNTYTDKLMQGADLVTDGLELIARAGMSLESGS